MFRTLMEKWTAADAPLDAGAMAAVDALEAAGYPAFLVGGCVRDRLLGREPKDWDLATAARPEETAAALSAAGFSCADAGGARYGTVLAAREGRTYEVTTFRRECYGADAHRPLFVTFAGTLEEDLARRDFTVNAMAMDAEGRLVDPFDGRKDLARKKLRTVGDAAERFGEDALRLFRACRFLGELDFMADASLVAGMRAAFPRVAGLSLTRVKREIEKLLVAEHAGRGLDLLVRSGLAETSCRVRENGTDFPVPLLPELTHLVGLPQMRQFHKYDAWFHTLAVVEASPRERLARWAALFHDVGKGMPGVRAVEGEKITDYNHDNVGAEMTAALLSRWRFPEKEIRLLTWLVKNHMKFHYYANVAEADAVKWVRHLARERAFPTQAELAEAIGLLTRLCEADIIGCGRPFSATEGHAAFGAYMEELTRAMPVTARELHCDAETARLLAPAGAAGFQNLLARVQNGSLPNEEAALRRAAEHFMRRHT